MPDKWKTALTRTTGRAISFDLTGQGLQAGHQLAIMRSCKEGIAFGSNIATTQDGFVYDFGLLSASGGSYVVCWCVNAAPYLCTTEDKYEFFVGDLLLHGPFPLSSPVVCVKGLACIYAPIDGVGLTTRNIMVISTTCGNPKEIRNLPHQLRGVAMEKAADGTWVLNYRDNLRAVRPAEYDLCWCDGQQSCIQGLWDSFSVRVGTMRLEGPESGQERSCARGKRCTFDAIDGLGLKAGDLVRVMLECGADAPVANMPGGGVANTSDGVTYNLGDGKLHAEVKSSAKT